MSFSHIDLRELRKRSDVEGLVNVLNTGDIREKREAAFILGELKSKNALKPLIGLLKKNDVQIRANAAWALGEILNKDAVLPLIDLLNDTSQIVQLHAAWALGRIGDDRAVPDLYTAMKNSSVEFRRVAKDAITRIGESKETLEKSQDMYESVNLPLITLMIPSDFIFKYPSLEGESKLEGTIRIAKGVIIEDTGDGKNQNVPRKIMIRLENQHNRYVSLDILFRCLDRTTGEARSAWLQLANPGNLNIRSSDEVDDTPDVYEENTLEELEGKQNQKKKKDHQRQRKPDARIHHMPEDSYEPVKPVQSKRTEPEIKELREPQPVSKPLRSRSSKEFEKTPIEAKPDEREINVATTVQFLGDIGLSGMENAASTLTQLSGQEPQSMLRTLPVEEICDEVAGLGDDIVLIEVNLHAKSGDMKGKMHLFFSKDTGLEIANELLCNQHEAFCEKFDESIISALKEVANIFLGQYVNAISEYVGVSIMLEPPKFEFGAPSQIIESAMKDVKGKVDFVLASDLLLGKHKTGRLVILLDPKSFDIIVSKLF